MESVEIGLCRCGCGGKTEIATRTRKDLGHIAGHPQKYINGHNARGAKNKKWNGGETVDAHGYIWVLAPNHSHANSKGYVRRSTFIAEKALGKPLPKGVEVHHLNGVPADDSPGNHVLCENHAYHALLEIRGRAYRACGYADWLKCPFCKNWDDPLNLSGKGKHHYHKDCLNSKRRKERKSKLKETIQRGSDRERSLLTQMMEG